MNLRRIGRAKRVPVQYILYTMIRRSFTRRIRNPKKIMQYKSGYVPNMPFTPGQINRFGEAYRRNIPENVRKGIEKKGIDWARRKFPDIWNAFVSRVPEIAGVITAAYNLYEPARDIFNIGREAWDRYMNRNSQRALPAPRGQLSGDKVDTQPRPPMERIPKTYNDVRHDRDTARYKRVVNKGSGITRTLHKVGKVRPLPKKIKSVGIFYKTVTASGAEDYITISTDPVKNGLNSTLMGTINGVKDQVYMQRADLAAVVTDIESRVGATQQTADFNTTLYVKNYISTTRITSASNANCTLRIYELSARRNVPFAYASSPLEAWKYGLDIYQGTISAGTLPDTQPDGGTMYQRGIYPSHSKVFKHFWKVESYYDVNLPAGATHIHTTEANVHQELPVFMINHIDVVGTFAYGGLTRARLYVLTGSPIHDATTEDNVSMALVKVDIATENTITFYGVPFKQKYLVVTNKPDTISAGQEVLADSGLIETTLVN